MREIEVGMLAVALVLQTEVLSEDSSLQAYEVKERAPYLLL